MIFDTCKIISLKNVHLNTFYRYNNKNNNNTFIIHFLYCVYRRGRRLYIILQFNLNITQYYYFFYSIIKNLHFNFNKK